MRKLVVPGFAGLLIISAASVACAQTGSRGVVGILTPSGTFQPLQPTTPEGSGTTFSGTLSLVLKMTVLSPAIPISTPIRCTLQAAVVGVGSTGPVDEITDAATAVATRSGSTANCTMTLPYEWVLFGISDTVTLTYLVSGTSSSTAAGRTFSEYFATIPVPADGAKTKYSLTGFF